MPEEPKTEKCPKCGGDRTPGRTGTITQWIVTCNCDLLEEEISAEDAAKVAAICATCGKRINPGRSGSFTQWVFRLDICTCEKPEPILATVEPDATPEAEDLEAVLPEDEEELEVDPMKFPLDRFKPISIIGSGSSGKVYCCRDRLLNKKLAVKTLQTIGPDRLVSFQKEAQATSRLNHASVIKVLDFGATEGGTAYMAMEFIDGVSLDEYIQSHGPLSVEQAIDVFTAVCSGLAHAHSHGILHRDIKSSNLLLQPRESGNLDVRIIDFGVAAVRQTRKDEQETQSTTMVGSPAYMPPDAALGNTYDERSEVYGLGCTIFEAITGRPPFVSDTALETIRMHAHDPAPSLADVEPDREFPEPLEEILTRCLAKDQAERYQTVIDLKEALDRLRPEPVVDVSDDDRPLAVPFLIINIPPKASIAILSVFVIVIISGSIAISYKTVNDETKTSPNVVEDGLDVTKLTSVIDSAVIKGRFRETTLDNGMTMLRARGPVTDKNLKEIKDRKDVTVLSIIGDGVTDYGMKYLLNLPLESIDIQGTEVTDRAIDRLVKIDTLRKLDLKNTEITDKGFEKLAVSSKIEDLSIGSKHVTDATLKILSKLKTLDTIELGRATNVTASGIASLARLPNLSRLELSRYKMTPASYRAIKRLGVKELTFSKVKLEDDDLKQIARLKLDVLGISGVDLSKKGVEYISRMKTLKGLSLVGCGLEDPDLQALSRLSNLKAIGLRANNLSYRGLKELKGIKNLEEMDLRNCKRLNRPQIKLVKAAFPACTIKFTRDDKEANKLFAEVTDSVLEAQFRMRKYRKTQKWLDSIDMGE